MNTEMRMSTLMKRRSHRKKENETCTRRIMRREMKKSET